MDVARETKKMEDKVENGLKDKEEENGGERKRNGGR